MPGTALTPAMLEAVAERFKALAEPARLRILMALRAGERTVGEIVDATSLNQANVSRHLRVLHALGFVQRRKDGAFVCYSLTGEDVFQLCDVMCARAETDTKRAARSLGTMAARRGRGASRS